MAVETPTRELLIPNSEIFVPRKTGHLPRGDNLYWINEGAEKNIVKYVADMEENPKGHRVGRVDLTNRRHQLIDRSRLLDVLPPGLSEEDFYKAVRISNLIECATMSYVTVFVLSARRHRARWLEYFATRIWGPDELEHADPFLLVALQGGYEEDELRREIRQTQEEIYEHTSGDTPVQMSGFGLVQEEITAVWHGQIAAILRKVSPELAADVTRTTGREHLHKMWYTHLTWLQIEGNSELRHLFADTLARFRFPGEVLIPDLYNGAISLLPQMGGDLNDLESELVRLIDTALSQGKRADYLGEAVLDVLYKTSEGMGVPAALLAKGISKSPILGRPFNIFIGQLVREREGLPLKDETPVEQKVANLTRPLREVVNRMTEDVRLVKAA